MIGIFVGFTYIERSPPKGRTERASPNGHHPDGQGKLPAPEGEAEK